MKKTLIWLLCACMMLSGCAGNPPTPTETNPPLMLKEGVENQPDGIAAFVQEQEDLSASCSMAICSNAMPYITNFPM